MPCTSPRTVGFLADGKTITWSPKKYAKEYATFQLPCGKCLSCRLEYARQWAVRCVHEARMHEKNCFITLTYSDEKLESPKLNYEHFQGFMKRLRKKYTTNDHTKIGVFVTGEYGEKTKRPHWHACIFNYQPHDLEYRRTTDRGDKVYSSKSLQETWGYGDVEIGTITIESAGYCARYAAKKLVHGNDQDHDYHPISKKSSKNAIGKKFIETYYSDVFNSGSVILADGTKLPIPRYYEKWLKKHKPEDFENYIRSVKEQRCQNAIRKENSEKLHEAHVNQARRSAQGYRYVAQRTKNESVRKILLNKFKQLQQKLKL